MVLARLCVKVLFGEHGGLLDHEADAQEGGEGVGEVADADGADEGAKVAEEGDGGGDDESEGPVDGDEDDPDELAGLCGQRWEVCWKEVG